ncbi:MAG: glycosyltransferase, partial [Spirochaetota bacterium]
PNDSRPVVMFLGGSLGARQINEVVAELRTSLRQTWRIVHQSGNNGVPPHADANYFGGPFFGEELPDLLAAADVLVCRAGASTLWEGAALAKPMLLVPLVSGSRGDQVSNAEIFARAGGAKVFAEAEGLARDLREELDGLARDPGARARMGLRARSAIRLDATGSIADITIKMAEESQ